MQYVASFCILSQLRTVCYATPDIAICVFAVYRTIRATNLSYLDMEHHTNVLFKTRSTNVLTFCHEICNLPQVNTPGSRDRKMISTNYLKLHTLGRGSFGKVSLYEDQDTQQLFAIKVRVSINIQRSRKPNQVRKSNQLYMLGVCSTLSCSRFSVHRPLEMLMLIPPQCISLKGAVGAIWVHSGSRNCSCRKSAWVPPAMDWMFA